VNTALGGLFLQYEPKYWWFELMILLNKTLMCGGLVVLAPGSPLQVLFAILIMLFHLLLVLKLAPWVSDSEDWSAFLATLGLCLLSLGAYSMMLDVEEHQMKIIGLVTTVVPLLCIATVICITICVDGGVWHKIQGRRKKNNNQRAKSDETGVDSNHTRIVPIADGNDEHDDIGEDGDARPDFDSSVIQRPLRPRSVIRQSTLIQDEFKKSEIALKAELNKKQQKQRRNTQLRLMARLKIKKNNALSKVSLFENVPPEGIDSILELTTYQKASRNQVLYNEGETATKFYIIVSGRCSVSVQSREDDQYLQVGTLKELDYFGESALCGGEKDAIRNATVTVESQFVQVLMLSRKHFDALIEQGVVTNEMVSTVLEEHKRRSKMTNETSNMVTEEEEEE